MGECGEKFSPGFSPFFPSDEKFSKRETIREVEKVHPYLNGGCHNVFYYYLGSPPFFLALVFAYPGPGSPTDSPVPGKNFSRARAAGSGGVHPLGVSAISDRVTCLPGYKCTPGRVPGESLSFFFVPLLIRPLIHLTVINVS